MHNLKDLAFENHFEESIELTVHNPRDVAHPTVGQCRTLISETGTAQTRGCFCTGIEYQSEM